MNARIAGAIGIAEKILQIVTAVFIGLLTLFVSWEVFARFVLDSGQFWAQEASLIVMTWIGLLGAAAAVWSDGHIRLSLIVNRLPPGGRRAFEIFSDLAVAGVSFVLFITGITLVRGTMGGTWSAIPIAIGYTNLIVPVTAGCMFAFSILRLPRRFFAASDDSASK